MRLTDLVFSGGHSKLNEKKGGDILCSTPIIAWLASILWMEVAIDKDDELLSSFVNNERLEVGEKFAVQLAVLHWEYNFRM